MAELDSDFGGADVGRLGDDILDREDAVGFVIVKGMAGEPPDLPSAVRLKELYQGWLGATSRQAQTQAWQEMLRIWADEVFSIGTVAGVLQPVVVSDNLRNVPEKGIYAWVPGAFFGIYRPDHFWFGPPSPAAKSASAVRPPAHPLATP